MTTVRAIQSNGTRLDRAIALGVELGKFARDPKLHALSRDAWDRKCRELCGCPDPIALSAIIDRVRKWPALWSEVQIRARLWADGLQDRPAPYAGFGHNGPQASYAEMLAGQLTIEHASAVAAALAAEWRPADSFGTLSEFSDYDALTEPRHAELFALDEELASLVRLVDVSWDGSAPVLRHAGFTLPVGPDTTSRIASGFAELAERMPVTAGQEQAA